MKSFVFVFAICLFLAVCYAAEEGAKKGNGDGVASNSPQRRHGFYTGRPSYNPSYYYPRRQPSNNNRYQLLLWYWILKILNRPPTTPPPPQPPISLPPFSGWKTYKDCRYRLFPTVGSYDAAKQDCVNRGAKLAHINIKNDVDRGFVYDMLNFKNGLAYVGLEDADGPQPGGDSAKWLDTTDYMGQPLLYLAFPNVRACAYTGPVEFTSYLLSACSHAQNHVAYYICEACT